MDTDATRTWSPARIRRAHFAIATAFAVHGAVQGSFATRIPWIKDHLDLSAGQLGLALVCPALGSMALMPLAGRIMHRLGSRLALRLLLAMWCAALVLPAVAPGLPWLCLSLLVFGATAGMADVVMNALGVEVEEHKGKSIMSGLHGMWSVGTLVGAAIGVPAAHAGIDGRVHLSLMAARSCWWSVSWPARTRPTSTPRRTRTRRRTSRCRPAPRW